MEIKGDAGYEREVVAIAQQELKALGVDSKIVPMPGSKVYAWLQIKSSPIAREYILNFNNKVKLSSFIWSLAYYCHNKMDMGMPF